MLLFEAILRENKVNYLANFFLCSCVVEFGGKETKLTEHGFVFMFTAIFFAQK